MSRSIPTSPENGTESTSSAFLSSALLLANELAIPSCDSSRVFALAANSGRDGTPLFGAAAGVFIFPSRSLYRSLGRMNADRHRNEGYLFSLYLTFYPRLNCGTHPQFVLMKFSNSVAVGSRLFFPPAWFCLFMQRIHYLIVSGCKISRKLPTEFFSNHACLNARCMCDGPAR